MLRALAPQREKVAGLSMGVRTVKVRVGNVVHVVELMKGEEGVKRRRRE